MKRVLLDVDGVVRDFTRACVRKVNELRHPSRTMSVLDWKHYHFEDVMAPHEVAHVKKWHASPGAVYECPMYPGAVEFMSWLGARTDVTVLTAGGSVVWNQATSRIMRPIAKAFMVCPAEHKQFVPGDCLIEDHPGTAIQWAVANPDGHVILMARPWNQPTSRHFAYHPRVHRAGNYQHARLLLTHLEIVTL